MFKKIHSNRNPEDTVYSEIRKEFAPIFNSTEKGLKGFLEKYPYQVFISMVAILLISCVLSFTVFKTVPNLRTTKEIPFTNNTKKTDENKAKTQVNEGISEMMQKTRQLMLQVHLKQEIGELINKKKLTAKDSLTLLNAIDSLQLIKTIK